MPNRSIGVEAVYRHVAAVTRALHRGPGHFRCTDTVSIDPGKTITKPTTDGHRAPNILCPYRRRQSIATAVGPVDGILGIAETRNRHNRTKYFVAGDLSIIIDIGDYGRLIKVTGALLWSATRYNFGRLTGAIDKPGDSLALPRRDNRPHLHTIFTLAADLDR